jgi:hypothetical protein
MEPFSVVEDAIGWYLYLAEVALHVPEKWDPMQGARVLPLFKRLGATFDLLMTVEGVEQRAARLLKSGRRQPDAALFELLVASLWRRNGWDPVQLLPEDPPRKTAIKAVQGADEWFIECKRLQGNSAYSDREQAKWLTMWNSLAASLIQHRFSVVFDIVFHVELETLSDTFMADELSGKLLLVHAPCTIISNDTWTVGIRPTDYASIRDHLAKYFVRYPSDQLNELIGGYRDPNRRFTAAMKGRIARMAPGIRNRLFVDQISFATGAFWNCDAVRSIERKARDIRGHLADAISQLPENSKGVVHVALETGDGVAVELERFRRICTSVMTLMQHQRMSAGSAAICFSHILHRIPPGFLMRQCTTLVTHGAAALNR